MKKRAGVTLASADGAEAVTGVDDPAAGSVTVGAGPKSGCAPPKSERLNTRKPKALPFTAVTCPLAGPRPAMPNKAAKTTAKAVPTRYPRTRACAMSFSVARGSNRGRDAYSTARHAVSTGPPTNRYASPYSHRNKLSCGHLVNKARSTVSR